MDWSVEKATAQFESMAKRAFSKRSLLKPFLDVPGAKLGARLFCSYLYKSESVESALKEAFSEDKTLFGDVRSETSELCKVAVVVTGEEEERLLLFTNYNRQWRVNDESSRSPARHALASESLLIEICRQQPET
jgi:hypothetical protein